MQKVLIEPVYAGPLSYYRALARAEQVVFDVHGHYQKRTYRNRCVILGANGRLTLSIPLLHGKSQKQPMQDVRISYEENWQKDHWMSLVSAYRRAPFFEYYEDMFRLFYEERTEFLSAYNLQYFGKIGAALKLPVPYTLTSGYIPAGDFGGSDLRDRYLPQYPQEIKPYLQVFADRMPFAPDLSILDVLFNLGPAARDYLTDQI